MDKTILKKFAVESRKDLMEKIKNKINTFYVDEEFKKEQKGEIYVLSNEKHSLSLTNEEYQKRELLIKRIKELSLEQVIEEAAYTWFNRIIAIRYMEINDYLPLTKDNQSLGIRVLSSKDNTPDPEILKFTNLINPDLDIDFKKEKYVELKDDNEKFKYVLLLVCKKLGRVIPQVFDGITDYIDILMPDNLLNDTGFITKIVNEVPEKNYNQVEIIGWLYQYYNQTEKDKAMGFKKQYNKYEIPYVTQLFTPDWIVKYLVENSLGRIWDESYPNSRSEKWRFYLNQNVIKKSKNILPEKITFFDPCCGSGHILVYAFEVLFQIYEEYGYNKKDISKKILEKNLFGLDIDERASQLTILSVLLKAREYDKYIFNYEITSKLNIFSIPESVNINEQLIEFLNEDNNKNTAKKLIELFKYGKDIGSLLIPNELNKENLFRLNNELNNLDTIFGIELKNKLNPLINAANILMNKYKILVTNPPYMSSTGMNIHLKEFVEKNYFTGKNDLFSAFIIKCLECVADDGYVAMITMQVWMFIASFEKFREELLNKSKIVSMLQIGFNSFPELNSKIALGTSFVLEKGKNLNYEGIFYDLNISDTNADKEKIFLEKKEKNDYFISKSSKYFEIAGLPIAYWVTDNVFEAFKNNKMITNYASPRQGMATGMNERFLRLWYEVSSNKIGFNFKNAIDAENSKKKWFPYNKGGDFRKWYGNIDYVVNWENNGFEIKHFVNEKGKLRSRAQNTEFYFKKGITWSFVNLIFGCRIVEDGFLFDVGGSSVFPDEKMQKYMLGYLNSNLVQEFLKILNPSLVFQVGNIGSLPYIYDDNRAGQINEIVSDNVELSKTEWNFYETSYGFKKSPLINGSKKIEDSVKYLKNELNQMFNKQKNNEVMLNKIFFDIFKINEFSADVEDKYISIRKMSEKQIIEDFISYAIGCMFGRYSLDKDGIICDNNNFNVNKYQTFIPDIDNIIPITDEAYFNDDIVDRLRQFVRVIYGSEYLNENLDYIANVLGKKGTETTEERIRKYFIEEFYIYHCNKYSVTGSGKRPIYWLFDSGKKNGFKALVYMHRYNENLIPKVRLDYLHRMQTTYEKLLVDVNDKLTSELSMTDKKEAQKRQADLNAKLQEIKEYDEKIAHIANQRISIDLDDGVKVNYDKFKDILAKIK